MLKIKIPSVEFFNEETNEFYYGDEVELELEHSLYSLSKWESKWHRPFLANPTEENKKTPEEALDYIKCMTLNEVNDEVYEKLPPFVFEEIEAYIEDPMTATTFSDNNTPFDRSIQTAEVIYYWMIKLGIPFECQHWPLQRLTTLIRVCSIKDGSDKKMSKREIYNQNRSLNAQRRAKFNSKG